MEERSKKEGESGDRVEIPFIIIYVGGRLSDSGDGAAAGRED